MKWAKNLQQRTADFAGAIRCKDTKRQTAGWLVIMSVKMMMLREVSHVDTLLSALASLNPRAHGTNQHARGVTWRQSRMAAASAAHMSML